MYIPQDAVAMAGLKKGDKCEVTATKIGEFLVTRISETKVEGLDF